MKSSSFARALRVAITAPMIGMSGCAGYAPNFNLLASGPSAEFDAKTQKVAADNQQDVITGISRMAGLKGLEPVGPVQWRLFGIAALGRARLECNAYVTEIMKIEEHRRTINQQLGLFGAATAGILGVAGAASSAIAITAIAFGLTQGTVDNVTTGLLYSLGAEPVQALIANLRGAYTDKLTAASWADRPTTFNTIYGYLELCTPVVLREKIKTAVATVPAQATDVDQQGGPPRVTLSTQQVLSTAVSPIPAPATFVPAPSLANDERGLRSADVAAIQDALCVTPSTGDAGVPGSGSPTRIAIKEFLSGRSKGALDPAKASDRLVPGTGMSAIRDAVAEATAGGAVGKCADRGYMSAFEVGFFGRNAGSADLASKIKAFQTDVNVKLSRDLSMDVDGKLETLRKTLGVLNKTNESTPLNYELFALSR